VAPNGKLRPELLHDASAQSQQAFAEILWARHLEPWVHLRRWPYRQPSARPDIVFSEAACRVTPDHQAGASGALLQADAIWLEYQAAACSMRVLWRAAVRQTQELSQMPVAAVGLLELATLDSFDWSARKLPDGSLRFFSLQAGEPAFAALPLPNKPARIKAFHAARLRTHNAVTQACFGPCLTWSPTDGWHVTDSATPQLGNWRRHKLLGVEGQTPHFWLFPWGGLFAARLCSRRLQVFSTTSAGAIQALRKCVAFSDRTLGPTRHDMGEQVLPCLTTDKESGTC
jgi:hypothetical protein